MVLEQPEEQGTRDLVSAFHLLVVPTRMIALPEVPAPNTFSRWIPLSRRVRSLSNALAFPLGQ